MSQGRYTRDRIRSLSPDAYWALNTLDGLNDASGHGRGLTAYGSPSVGGGSPMTWETQTGVADSSTELNGSSQYFMGPADWIPWAADGSLTIACALKPHASSAALQALISGAGAGGVPPVFAVDRADGENFKVAAVPDQTVHTGQYQQLGAGTGDYTTGGPGGGSQAWDFASRITSYDQNGAFNEVLNTYATYWLRAYNFGFNVPTYPEADITGIQFDVWKYKNGGCATSDYDCRVMKGGSAAGNNRAIGGDWASDTWFYTTYGGGSDFMGESSWSPAQVNNSGFGFLLSRVGNAPTVYGHYAQVDYVRATVYYTAYGGVGMTLDSWDLAAPKSLIITYNDSTGDVYTYLSGTLMETHAQTGDSFQSNAGGVVIGRNPYNTTKYPNYDGELAHVAIWNRVLNATERGVYEEAITKQPAGRIIEAGA